MRDIDPNFDELEKQRQLDQVYANLRARSAPQTAPDQPSVAQQIDNATNGGLVPGAIPSSPTPEDPTPKAFEPAPMPARAPAMSANPDAVRSLVGDQGPVSANPDSVKSMVDAPTPKEYGFGDELNDAALKRTQGERNDRLRDIGIGSGFSRIAAALTGIKPDTDYWDKQTKQAGTPIEDIQTRRKGMTEEEAYRSKAELNDPASPDNQAFRAFVKEKMPALSKTPGFDSLTLNNPALTKIADMWMKSEDRKAQMALAASNQAIAQSNRMTEESRRQRTEVEKEMENLQKTVQGGTEVAQALKTVEGKLGFDLDKYDPKSGTANGKKVDLPGVSIPGIGRITAYSSDARELQGAADRVFNTVLKDRSGAAVTTGEMDRLRREFNAGTYNTESDLLQALRDYKGQLRTKLQNQEAGYRPDIKNEFKSRGGQLSSDILGANQQQPQYTQDVLNYATAHKITPEQANQIKMNRTGGK
jgi:hypothetical protein